MKILDHHKEAAWLLRRNQPKDNDFLKYAIRIWRLYLSNWPPSVYNSEEALDRTFKIPFYYSLLIKHLGMVFSSWYPGIMFISQIDCHHYEWKISAEYHINWYQSKLWWLFFFLFLGWELRSLVLLQKKVDKNTVCYLLPLKLAALGGMLWG